MILLVLFVCYHSCHVCQNYPIFLVSIKLIGKVDVGNTVPTARTLNRFTVIEMDILLECCN